MLLTLSPFEPFKQNPHPAALANLSFLSPEAMVGSPASASLHPQDISPYLPNPSRLNLPASVSSSATPSLHHHHQLHSSAPTTDPDDQKLQSQARPALLKRKRSEDSANARPAKRTAMDADAQSAGDLDESKAKSPDEKKRNKLGYHRTSVACSHCRRRKIRCMIPDNDTTGRCANCIRLKKECTFCPVEESGTSRGARSGAVGAASSSVASSKNQSPEAVLKSSQISPSVPTLQSRPQFMSPAIPPGGLGIFESPHSAIHDQQHWYPPAHAWERTSPLGVDPDYGPNYNLSHQPLTSPYAVPPHNSNNHQMHGHIGSEMTPQPEDGQQVPQSAHPYAPNLALRTDLSWSQAGQSVHSSRSMSHSFPHALSPQPSLEPSAMPRRAATLPGPLPPQIGYIGSSTPSTISEPMSLPNTAAQPSMMPPEWQPVDWNMPPHNQDTTFKAGSYPFDVSWYQQQQQQQQQQHHHHHQQQQQHHHHHQQQGQQQQSHGPTGAPY